LDVNWESKVAAAIQEAPRLSVIGLGYVGLPLAAAFAAEGLDVTGFDISRERIAELKAGRDRTGEVEPQDFRRQNLQLTTDAADLTDRDVHIVTVPTPVDAANRPDLGPLDAACRTVGQALRASRPHNPAPIVVFESTVYPGVTEDICRPLIERESGRRCGQDFFLGYSPERINPGDRTHRLDSIVKVVAGQTAETAERLRDLYGRVAKAGVFVARNIRTAEAAKVIENAQRDINIAFINEVTMIFERLGLSIYDVLEASRTKWNFLDFKPGLVGGHCIGVDPYYLAACAVAAGHDPEIILSGRRINDAMGDYFADRIHLETEKNGTRTPRTLVLGLTFKENVPDLRNTKVIDLVRGLVSRGHRVDVHDPQADAADAKAHYGLSLLGELSASPYDCVICAVPHDTYREFDAARLGALVKPGGLVADLKGVWRTLQLPPGLRRWQP
jgi:UDP-N-acetyl-D-glucosamine/UDP-N-acetyl-D-galactosamine dehydrogenase